ncbi:MAG: Hsp20/alpha crystallin family protein [Actinomycetota bacterium]
MAIEVTKWDPFRDLLGIQNEMTRLFGRALGDDTQQGATTWAPPIDVYEMPDAYHVVAELPGFGPSDVDVTVNDGTLQIRGERKFYDAVREESFHRVERKYGAFYRALSLPSAVQADKIKASFDKGLLSIEIPKAETAKPRRIEIKASGTQ